MNALSHAIEGYTIPKHSEFSDLFYIAFIQRVLKYLLAAV